MVQVEFKTNTPDFKGPTKLPKDARIYAAFVYVESLPSTGQELAGFDYKLFPKDQPMGLTTRLRAGYVIETEILVETDKLKIMTPTSIGTVRPFRLVNFEELSMGPLRVVLQDEDKQWFPGVLQIFKEEEKKPKVFDPRASREIDDLWRSPHKRRL